MMACAWTCQCQVAVSYIQDSVHFDKDIEVSTFEVNIRSLDILGIHTRLWAHHESIWHYGKGKGVGVWWEGLVILNLPLCNLGILGGLLSGHQHAVKVLPKYKGGLLNKARR